MHIPNMGSLPSQDSQLLVRVAAGGRGGAGEDEGDLKFPNLQPYWQPYKYDCDVLNLG